MFDSKKWNVLVQDEELTRRLSDVLGIDEICARLLINRGYTEEDGARAFIGGRTSAFQCPS